MALNVFTTGSTLQQIVADCERMTANPKLNIDPITGSGDAEPTVGNLRNAPAYRWLLEILRDLALVYDWGFVTKFVTTTLPSGSRTINLPNDYWRGAYDHGVFLIDSSIRVPLVQYDRQNFYGPVFNMNNTGRPHSCFIDRSLGTISFEPISDKPYFLELHYFPNMAEPDEITDRPWFPYTEYLQAALLVKYFADQDDQRVALAEAERARMFARIRSNHMDIKEDPQQGMPLDPIAFPTPVWDD